MSIHEEVIESLKKAHDLMPTEDIDDMYDLESKMRAQIRKIEDLIRPLMHAKMALQTSMEKLEKRRLGIEYMFKLQMDAIERESAAAAKARRAASRRDKVKRTSKSNGQPDISAIISNMTPDQAAALLAALQGQAK